MALEKDRDVSYTEKDGLDSRTSLNAEPRAFVNVKLYTMYRCHGVGQPSLALTAKILRRVAS